MIRIHIWGSSLTGTPFRQETGIQYFVKEGVSFTDEKSADLIISGNLKQILGLMLRYGAEKKYLLWSMEPRWCKHFKPRISGKALPDFHVMNIYTGIFDNNYLFLPVGPGILHAERFSNFKNKKVVSLMSYQSGPFWKFIHDGTDLDLCNLRTRIALGGYNRGCIDIYGKGWPGNIAIGESRATGWEEKKNDILGMYHFNLCFENTNWPYYCTEKIWHSIQGGCLPIYFGNSNKIYEDFPENSFLDYCNFNDAGLLFDYILDMKPDEFEHRMQLCLQSYDRALLNKKELKPYKRILQKTLLKFQSILSSD